jgi:integrase
MPATQRGHARRLPGGRWQLRYYDEDGRRHSGGVFDTKTAALDHYRDMIEPRLRGEEPKRPLTFDELCERFLARHETIRSARTVATLRERLGRPRADFGSVNLADLERMADVIADWRLGLPDRYRYAVTSAFRQVLAAGVRWSLLGANPAAAAGANPTPPPRAVRAFSREELDALEAELPPAYASLVTLGAAIGARPAELAGLERADVDRGRRLLTVRGTKTRGSVRQVPLSARALAALDRIPARLDSRCLFPASEGGPLNLDNFRRRVWTPAVEASGVRKPARLYDLRSTFASDALAAGVVPFELAKVMGTSTRMLELHYGTLLAGAGDGIAARLDALDAQAEADREARS